MTDDEIKALRDAAAKARPQVWSMLMTPEDWKETVGRAKPEVARAAPCISIVGHRLELTSVTVFDDLKDNTGDLMLISHLQPPCSLPHRRTLTTRRGAPQHVSLPLAARTRPAKVCRLAATTRTATCRV